jgi:thymidylate synthase (FAD)
MQQVRFSSDVVVDLIRHSAQDIDVARAAWVSTKGEASKDVVKDEAKVSGLINYLMRDRHGSPFEHSYFTFYVKAPIFVWREHMRHRMACLSGDTEIYFENNSGGYWKRIDKHYEDWNNGVLDSMGRRRILLSVRKARVRSFDEDTLEKTLSDVADVVESGIKEVYEVTTARGRKIKTSIDHKFFTPRGWKKLSQLSVGDEVWAQQRNFHSIDPETRSIPKSLRQGIQVWTSQQRQLVFNRDGSRCAVCGDEGAYVDHKVAVSANIKLALDIDNLQILCKECNGSKTNSEQVLAQRDRMGLVKTLSPDAIVSIVPIGPEMTYDLVLEGNHNFLGNGIVVHNSYNEESGRYAVLKPEFYIPARERNLQQIGKTGHYQFIEGTNDQYAMTKVLFEKQCIDAYQNYEQLLANGIAKEVARIALPLNIYSSAYVTMNARALMNFLSLRQHVEGSHFPSYPQREIEMVAERYEEILKEHMPITYAAFAANGRVAP